MGVSPNIEATWENVLGAPRLSSQALAIAIYFVLIWMTYRVE